MANPLHDHPRSPMDGPDDAQPPPNLLDQAKTMFPALAKHDLDYIETPMEGKGYLEFWPGDEPGSEEFPRPEGLKKGKAGVQILDPRTTPLDVAADVVSHHLINEDKTVAKHYERFEKSLTDDQKDRLKEQYEHAQEHMGEKRSFQAWKKQTGLPGYFRGYAFQQWAKDRDEAEARGMYTKEQLDDFDDMLKYLKKK